MIYGCNMSKIWSVVVTENDIVFSQNGQTLTVPVSNAEKWMLKNLDHECGGCNDLPTKGFFKSKKTAWCKFSREIATLFHKGFEWVSVSTIPSKTKYGSFDQEVLQELNSFLKEYPLAPGSNDECTYFIGYNDPEVGGVQDWIHMDDARDMDWGDDFGNTWDKLKDRTLFTGRLFILKMKRSFYYLDGEVETVDQTVRGFRFDTEVSVLKVLNAARYILYDPENLTTGKQGVIGSIKIDESGEIPTLFFYWSDA